MPKTSPPRRPGDKRNDRRDRVQIDIYSLVALIDPPVPLLEPYLEYRQMQFEEDEETLNPSQEEDEETRYLWQFDHAGRMGVPAGLVPRLVRILMENGYKVKVTDHRRFGKRLAIDKKSLGLFQGEDRRLLDAVRREPLGQIEVRGFNDMIQTMRLIVELYPKARVLIPVATKSLARRVRSKLRAAAMDFDVNLRFASWPQEPSRCLVCTFYLMLDVRADQWDVILLPDPKGATGDWSIRAMGLLLKDYDKPQARVYSFLQRGLRLGHRDRLRLEAASGPVIYRLAPEHVGVRVLWLPTPRCKRIAGDATPLQFKRKAYWHNEARNEYIAAVARALAKRDLRRLGEYGVPFSGFDPVLRHWPYTRIAVLTASTEQARELAKHLPKWTVLDAVPDKAGKEPGAAKRGTPTIVTEAKAAKDGLDADVVIRAGGSPGNLCFKHFPPAPDVKEFRDVILLDLSDVFDERAVQDARRRRREYELLGWENEPERLDHATGDRA